MRIPTLLAISASAIFLAACVTPPSTNGGPSAPTVSVPLPSGGSSSSSGGSSGSSSAGSGSSSGSSGGGSAGGGNAGSGLPSGGLPGGLPGPSGSGTESGGGTASSGGSQGSPQGAADGGEEGSPDGTGTTNGEGEGADVPSWETSSSAGGEGENSESGGGLGDGGFGTFSDAELEDLERTLEEAIGTFDGEILREQENARDKTGNVGSAGGQQQVEVLAGVGEFETVGGGAPGPTGTSSGGDEGTQQVFDDAPPLSPDDDVVARQIREAAMKEQDPEQRKILWEEYERYKGGS